MKSKIYLLIIVLSIFCEPLFAQLSRQQAIDTVLNHLLVSDTGKAVIYLTYEVLENNDSVRIDDGSYIHNPYENSWLFYIDDYPFANWHHQVRYMFLNRITGSYSITEHQLYPVSLEENFELISNINVPPSPDIVPEQSTFIEPLTESEDLYAVIICGYETHPRYWYDVSSYLCNIKRERIYRRSHYSTLCSRRNPVFIY